MRHEEVVEKIVIICVKIVICVNIHCCWIHSHYTAKKSGVPYLDNRAQHSPSNLYPYLDHNHQQRPMPTHAHP